MKQIGVKVHEPRFMLLDPATDMKVQAFKRTLLNIAQLPGFDRWEIRTSGYDTEYVAWIKDGVTADAFLRSAKSVSEQSGWIRGEFE